MRSAAVTGVAPAALVATLAVALGSGLGAAPAMAQDAVERGSDRLVVGDLSPGALALVDAAFVPDGAGAGVPSAADGVDLASIAQMADFNTVGAGLPIPGPADFGRETVRLDNISLADIGPEYADPADRAGLAGRQRPRRDYASFGEDVKAIKWEFAAVAGYYTATNAPKLFKDPQFPTFQREGWFGRSTNNVGVDKLAHAYSAYVISELLYGRLKRNTGDAPGIEWTAAALGSGIMLWSEAFDSIEPTSGWSWEDVAMNTAGAGFSVLRNSVPGLDEKLDFRLMIEPNEDIFTPNGKAHFQQQRYFFALKAAGFSAFDRSPLRFLELHLGYHGDDFLLEDRAAGITPRRHVFVGAGLNLRELLFRDSRSRVGRAVGEVLDYFQLPYTAVHTHITD